MKEVVCEHCESTKVHSRGTKFRKKLGVNVRSYHCLDCKEWTYIPDEVVERPNVLTPPELPSTETPIEDLIAANCKRVEKKIAKEKAHHWMPFQINTLEPVMVVFMGDPHVDDDKCNWPLLQEHVRLMQDPHVFGVNMGDLVNNWVGRLIAEYAEAHVTRSEGWRLAEWLIKDSGVNWLVHILGNHDTWNDGVEILARTGAKNYIAEDWRARFKLVFPNDIEVKIDAAHDHKGHSQYNPTHAQKKVSLFEEPADIIIAGHKHTWALSHEENPHTGFTSWYARARGYKLSFSGYDKRGGWGNQWGGASIAAVIDPTATSQSNRVTCFSDLHTAKNFLNTLRMGATA